MCRMGWQSGEKRGAGSRESGGWRTAGVWALVAASLLVLGGCQAERPALGRWEGPQLLSTSSVEAWSYQGKPARRIKSKHYVIYTTIDDEEVLDLLPQVMEGALAQYRKVAPGT